jgi:hypothetical protein
MGKINLTLSEAIADELSQALEAALAPPPPIPLTLEERVAALEARKFRPLRTPFNAERVQTIVATQGHPYQYYVLYSLPLPDIKAGDMIEAFCQFQMTHIEANADARYMVGKFLMIGDSPTDAALLKPKLNSPTALNIERLRVHEPIHHFGDYIAPQDLTGKHLNAVVYSQRLGAAGNGTIRVDQGYGHLSVKIWPASMIS